VNSDLPAWALRLISELNASDGRAEAVAQGLTPEQLNWKPRPDAWSVGQCLEHLHLANEVYLPAISLALEGRQPVKVQDVNLSWLSRWFIRNYIAPNPQGTQARAPKKIEPAKEVHPLILQSFLRSNQEARQLVRRAGDFDVNLIRFKNPFIPLLRFTVGTGLEIIPKHQSRHLLQAERVRLCSNFPQ
jgi:DinB superfamily